MCAATLEALRGCNAHYTGGNQRPMLLLLQPTTSEESNGKFMTRLVPIEKPLCYINQKGLFSKQDI